VDEQPHGKAVELALRKSKKTVLTKQICYAVMRQKSSEKAVFSSLNAKLVTTSNDLHLRMIHCKKS
jgi:hypothetical protein